MCLWERPLRRAAALAAPQPRDAHAGKAHELAGDSAHTYADLAAEVGASVASVEDIIKAKDVDAILIATPTPFHAEQIEAGSNAGKAVLCEKPVSLSVARIEECLKTVEKNKTPLMIGFNRRFDPNFAALQKRLRAGAIGNIEMATIISRDPAPPPASYVKSSGGIFRDMMIHDLDLARFLVGEEFVVVNALGSALVDARIGEEGDCDTAAVQMQTASGKICVITNSRRATYGYDQRIEVHGSKGMLCAGNIHNTTVEVATAEGFHPISDEERTESLNDFFEELFNSIDYSLLIIFLGTFVVVANIDSTGIPKYLW